MTDAVLAVNAGSSSIKFAVYPVSAEGSDALIGGKVSGIGREPVLTANDHRGIIDPTGTLIDIPRDATHGWLVAELLQRLRSRFTDINPVAVGHRVVHGGRDFTGPVLIDEENRRKIERLTPMAPLHQPHNLAAVDAIAEIAPEVAQVACFDTSFHRTQPRLAQLSGLPRALTDEGVLRYGFHGLSYEYIARVLPDHLGDRAEGRVIVAHLGNGASMCAMKDRRSVATTMGFTALEGLPMGRRCGSLDPGVVLYLLEIKGMSPPEIQRMLYRESGLLGVSGVSNNMQVLEASDDPHAREAIEFFCYRAAREMGSLAMALGGLDALVFTAGIGENSSVVRRLICERSAWLGLELDRKANECNAARISTDASDVDILVVPTNEEAVIVDSVRACLGEGSGGTVGA